MAVAGVSVGSQISWGVVRGQAGKSFVGGTGVVVGFNSNRQSTKSQCRNEMGSVIGERIYDFDFSAGINIQIPSNFQPPSATQIVQLGGKSYMVDSCELVESNTNFMIFNIRLHAYANTFTPVIVEGIQDSMGRF